ncbi:hypothetical protein [Streptomyces sp. NPDC018045]|uniref:hypothetical protein n=1 Tax=Streptomyces sp. NPDC018045 TaxID=3365037 RepID=UPI0037B557D2
MAAIPLDLLDRIRALERQVRELSGRAQMRPALNTINHGTVTIGEGGQLRVQAPNGHDVFGTGQSPQGDWYVEMAREDGTPAVQVGNNTFDGDDVRQMVRLRSRSGDVIVMDDYYADGYLGRPWVPVPMSSAAYVTGSEWRTTHVGRIQAQHAVLAASWSVYAPPGTTAETRLMINRGGELSQLGEAVEAGGKEVFTTQRLTPGDHRLNLGDTATLVLQARRASGSGTGEAWCLGMWGVHTTTANEAN